MESVDRVAGALLARRRLAAVVVLAAILAVGAGVVHLEQDATVGAMEAGTDAEANLEYVESNFSAGSVNETVTQVVLRDENALDKETLLASLRLQRAVRTNESVGPTLREDETTVGVANLVARAAIAHRQASTPGAAGPADPTAVDHSIDRQIAALRAMDERQVEVAVRRVLGPDGPGESLALMPTTYEPGDTRANATMVVAFQAADRPILPGNAPDSIVAAQTAIQDIADRTVDAETLVVGPGVITAETSQARADTFRMVGPLALLFVLVTLAVVYRDAVDFLLSLAGIVLVQVWTFGALGWLGISFNPILIAVPVLLIGLSIDYGVHVFTRYRELRARTGDGPGEAMRAALSGVGVALLWVTVTTVVGFLSNLASPLGPIRELGVIAAIGIVGSLVVFGGLAPPLKAEIDALRARFGRDRVRRPIGEDGDGIGRVLGVGATAARRAPLAVVLLALLVTGATTVAATDVRTSFEPEDNVPEAAPEWTESLPDPIQPGDYTAKANLRYVNDRFLNHEARAEFLLRGDVTDPAVLDRIGRAEAHAAEQDTAVTLADGSVRATSPRSVIRQVAARDDEFAATVAATDTDGDGLPESDLADVYDRLFAVAPERASRVLHREGGEYVAARMAVPVVPDAPGEAIVAEMETVAGTLAGPETSTALTGEPVVQQTVQDRLLETVLVSLFATLAVVLGLLAVVYRRVRGSATLGLVTLVPVVFTVSWIVATMTAVGYPLSVLTSVVASITIGIGIDYSIHVSERFGQELDTGADPETAITATVRGTGAALLGSATTTAIGFGVLGFALLPPLRQFGAITAVMIGYAFLASVLVLPSLLVLWARYVRGVPEDIDRPAAADPEASD